MNNNTLCDEDMRAVNEILMKALEIAESEITYDAVIREDLAADSLAAIEINMAVEDRFNVVIPDAEWEKVRTVGDLYEALSKFLPVHR